MNTPATPLGKERAKAAYDTFRGGFRGDAPCPVPHWDDAPAWVRDAVISGYLQGSLDAIREWVFSGTKEKT